MNKKINIFANPFKPGAGHMPPYLAGREKEKNEFSRLLKQDIILENLILTGLRGVGKTVLLETFMPIAFDKGWLWTGSNLSESASVSEDSLVIRILTDISILTANIVTNKQEVSDIGFNADNTSIYIKLDLAYLINLYKSFPGLPSDKLKNILEFVWPYIEKNKNIKGVIFAYDESQNMSDHAKKEQYPLSLLLDVFQSIQRKNIPFMLVLVGLPTLFPKLVETRTYSERMFRVVFLGSLSEDESKEAIEKPIDNINCSVKFSQDTVETIAKASGGYPYFIQFICREAYDLFYQKINQGENNLTVPLNEIIAKLDTDFFAGRWLKATDRQRDLLFVIAELTNCNEEFTVAEIRQKAKNILKKQISSSQINQLLASLICSGLIYKNRHGKYSFAVPLLGEYIKRQKYKD